MNVVLFYVPDLRPESAPADVPEQVAFFPCGLPAAPGPRRPARSPEAEAALDVVSFPLSPPEARATLEELLRLGLEYSPHGLLSTMAGYGKYEADRTQDASERTDLDFFAASGEVPQAGRTDPAEAAKSEQNAQAVCKDLIDAQKILILADYLEEKNLERAALEKRVLLAEQALHASLSEGENPCAEAADLESGNADRIGNDFPRVAPRMLLRAVLHFLPKHAALFTADDGLITELLEEGRLGPLPADRAGLAAPWPEQTWPRLLYAVLSVPLTSRSSDAQDPAFMRKAELLALPGPGIRVMAGQG
ncbi:MAG: hypothetical protein LBQ51_05950 [Desulfovibrio sp.]|jgi:hypothetical protein|nr:hypothetical protein [Desulfovibrio sp.]